MKNIITAHLFPDTVIFNENKDDPKNLHIWVKLLGCWRLFVFPRGERNKMQKTHRGPTCDNKDFIAYNNEQPLPQRGKKKKVEKLNEQFSPLLFSKISWAFSSLYFLYPVIVVHVSKGKRSKSAALVVSKVHKNNNYLACNM